ncbi:MAG: hypothetical protein RLY93_05035 [Sumerlaeia bacterium]
MNDTLRSLPLARLHTSPDGGLTGVQGWAVPATFGNRAAEYRQLIEGAALLDVSFLTIVRAAGPDREDYLNRRLSQKMLAFAEGEGRRAALLDSVGKMEADMEVFASGEELILLAPPVLRVHLRSKLDLYVFSEDVQFRDASEAMASFALIGPKRAEVLKIIGLENPAARDRRFVMGQVQDGPEVAALSSELFPGGVVFMCAQDRGAELWQRLEEQTIQGGGALCGWEAFEAYRILHGAPWYGTDLDDGTIPLEADLLQALHFDKGCYPGQETIAKISNLGHPARKLVRLRFSHAKAVAPDLELTNEAGAVCGRIRSCAAIPNEDSVVALAMVKWPQREPGTVLSLTQYPDVKGIVEALRTDG